MHLKTQPLEGSEGIFPQENLKFRNSEIDSGAFWGKMGFCMVEIEFFFTIMSKSMKNILLF